ncbi:hypothetical protein BS50DRAFT_270454 [Corynespora cassiicola Philippines]|uniref:Uncharacterized protein n=1 Tax=Corynespora cassiicola Philippines TaxID=1448308 RepID=A0A2T2NZX8_CORCC|nr:hypothetical protein BS50DRAFT_270454 [Corynespora cassiicola Philippines]
MRRLEAVSMAVSGQTSASSHHGTSVLHLAAQDLALDPGRSPSIPNRGFTPTSVVPRALLRSTACTVGQVPNSCG